MAGKQFVGYMEAYVTGENFNVYLERLENYMELNEAIEEKYKIMLLSNLIGPEASHKLSKACKPKKPKEYTYDEIIEKCKDLFAPKFTSCINAVKFNRRVQARGEGIHDFAIELMALAESCQFGDYKDKALRNQFISGVYNRNLRADLMALDEKKTFNEMLQRAMAAEVIQKDVDLNFGASVLKEVDVNKVHNQHINLNEGKSKSNLANQDKIKTNNSWDDRRMRNSSQGRNYGETRPQNRDIKNLRCFNCGKYGHFARECRLRTATSSGFGTQQERYNNNNYSYKDRNVNNYGDKFTKYNGDNDKFLGNKENWEKSKQGCIEQLDFGNLSLNEIMQNSKISNVGRYESFEEIKIDSKSGNSKVGSCRESQINKLNKFNGVTDGMELVDLNSTELNVGNIGKADLLFSNVEFIDVVVEDKVIKMEIDTGACVSLCAWEQYKKDFAHVKLEVNDIPLSVLTGEQIKVVGKLKVKVKLKEEDQYLKVELVVVDTKKKMFPVLGRSWLDRLFPGWREWFRIEKVLDNSDFRNKSLEEIRKKGVENGNADCLSRLPIQDRMSEKDLIELEGGLVKNVNGEVPLDLDKVGEETENDPYLRKLKNYILNGWKESDIPRQFKRFYLKNEGLSVEKNCIWYGTRLVIPESLKKGVLKLLHVNHSGVVRMKVVARGTVFWEGIDGDIESYVKSCESCQVTANNKSSKVYCSWSKETYPFNRVHIDFFYFERREFLIYIDAYSRWLEVIEMNGTSAMKVIDKLEQIFRIFGFPNKLVADNGPPFGSERFRMYCESKGIELIHSPPYHPASNGQIERAVQTTKTVLKKFVLDSERNNITFDLRKSVEAFLKNYNNLPCTEAGFIPSEKVFNYKPRTTLDLLKNEKNLVVDKDMETIKEKKVQFCIKKEGRMNSGHENKKIENFLKGEDVLYLNSGGRGYDKWLKARIIEKESMMIYKILVCNIIKRAHVNQLRKSALKYEIMDNDSDRFNFMPDNQISIRGEENSSDDQVAISGEENGRILEETRLDEGVQENVRPQRIRRIPNRFNDYVRY